MPLKPHDPGLLRVSQLDRRGATDVLVAPDADTRTGLAQWLDLIALPRLRLSGRVSPAEGGGFRLIGRIEAEVVQRCVVTLAPVTTVIDGPIARHWSPHYDPLQIPGNDAAEPVEIGDDEIEPLGSTIDLNAVLAEELSLAIPAWPRAEGVALPPEISDPASESGETRRPFAGLSDALRKRD